MQLKTLPADSRLDNVLPSHSCKRQYLAYPLETAVFNLFHISPKGSAAPLMPLTRISARVISMYLTFLAGRRGTFDTNRQPRKYPPPACKHLAAHL